MLNAASFSDMKHLPIHRFFARTAQKDNARQERLKDNCPRGRQHPRLSAVVDGKDITKGAEEGGRFLAAAHDADTPFIHAGVCPPDRITRALAFDRVQSDPGVFGPIGERDPLLALVGFALDEEKFIRRQGPAKGPLQLQIPIAPVLAAVRGRNQLRRWIDKRGIGGAARRRLRERRSGRIRCIRGG